MLLFGAVVYVGVPTMERLQNFNRPRYQVLKEDVLRAGDELIITEVDRLGRNKQETLKELQLVLCQDLVQVKMRNFSHFNLPKAQP